MGKLHAITQFRVPCSEMFFRCYASDHRNDLSSLYLSRLKGNQRFIYGKIGFSTSFRFPFSS